MPLTDQLQVFYEFESGALTTDAHSNGYTLTNNGVTSSAGPNNKVGGSGQFTRSELDYMSRAHNANLTAGSEVSFTVACWIYIDSAGTVRSIATKGDDGTLGAEWRIRLWSDDLLMFTVFQSGSYGGGDSIIAGSALSTATWYFIAARHDASSNQLKLRVNTTDTTPVSYSNNVVSLSVPLLLGNDGFASNYWDGRIDQFGFWNRALTDQELTDLYNGGSGLSYAAMSSGGGNLSVLIGEPITGSSVIN